MTQDNYMLKIVCNFLPTLVFLIYFIILYKEQQNYNDYYKTSCYIYNTTYPTNITQLSFEFYWIPCSCGKRCQSVSPCLSLYTPGNSLPLINSYHDKNEDCTFYQKPCIGNENPLVLFDLMVRFMEMGQDYQNLTISCYKNKNHPDKEKIYINLKDVSTTLYIISIFFGLFMLINIYLVIRLFWFNDDVKKQKKFLISHNSIPVQLKSQKGVKKNCRTGEMVSP